MEEQKNFKILPTNLKAFFWKNVLRVMKQNRKTGLEEFLFSIKSLNSLNLPAGL